MKVLVGCEKSQEVCKAFRKIGHEAFSCDITPCTGFHPEWHIQGDVLDHLNDNWDMAIFFPPCTYLTVSQNRWLKDQPARASGALVGMARREARAAAIDFVMKLANCDIPKICIENPKGTLSTVFRKPNQIIQPWQFGHGEKKATHLWLKNLPLLHPTNIVSGRRERIFRDIGPGPKRQELRSTTYPGIAQAMAAQWG
jgi:hypothetical protein